MASLSLRRLTAARTPVGEAAEQSYQALEPTA